MVLKQQQSITNKAKIHEYMESTFDYREQQISVTLTSASQIFEEYPRYVDFENGSLILHDFYRKYKDAHSCLETRFFGRFQNALVGLAERKKVEVTKSTDESLGALVLCLKVMPSVSRIKKADFSSKLGRLFYFVKENASISSIVESKDEIYHKQPFLIVSGTLEHPLSFFLVIEKTAIPVGSNCAHAFHVLFASFFIFRLEYPQYLDKFFLFFEQFVFQIGKNISACNQEFANCLDNVASATIPQSLKQQQQS
ncbi:uncharacterized protein LOC116933442 [Daphnia magna]|uniref:uncharacterized protein LOC116933442 n=1 Tax=Daphnia magna TaxID=35525 RepID=UPI001E1BCFF4|nr:uncharacterized protein LOC116933442 [Daphnia magna]XP_045029980.1 uncharacterized protein LOC116933442 [Daphnia magna]XP_045029981.1 uncharacterized protein LOC116933442 [Daphnia magna]